MTSIVGMMGVPTGVLAQSAPGGGPGTTQLVIMVVGMVAIMYFMLWRPQTKQRKEHQSMLDQLKKGDAVVTSGGILGKVSAIADKYVVLEITRDTKMRVLRHAIQSKAPEGLFDAPETVSEGSNTKE